MLELGFKSVRGRRFMAKANFATKQTLDNLLVNSVTLHPDKAIVEGNIPLAPDALVSSHHVLLYRIKLRKGNRLLRENCHNRPFASKLEANGRRCYARRAAQADAGEGEALARLNAQLDLGEQVFILEGLDEDLKSVAVAVVTGEAPNGLKVCGLGIGGS